MNLFCQEQKVATPKYKEGYFRTFIGMPKLNKHAKALINHYIDTKEYKKAILFFMVHCDYDQDYSAFIVRELIKENTKSRT